jgi:hypothetical protein
VQASEVFRDGECEFLFWADHQSDPALDYLLQTSDTFLFRLVLCTLDDELLQLFVCLIVHNVVEVLIP